MSGRPIEEAKQAIGTFLDRAPLHQLESCHLIVYDNRVSLCQDMQGLTKMNRDNTVSSIYACGGTSFACPLDRVLDLATACPMTGRHVVCFFTDGCDCDRYSSQCSLEHITKALGDRSWQVHCFGFGRSHDAAFLSSLALAGTEPGGFSYIQNPSADLEPALDTVLEELHKQAGGSFRRLRCTLHAAGMSQSIMLLQEQSAEPDASGIEVGSPKDGDTSVANAGDGAAACVAAGSLTLFRGHACFKCSADDLAAAAAAAGGKVQLKLSEPVGGELEVALTVQEAPMQDLPHQALALVKDMAIGWTNELANGNPPRDGILAIRDTLHDMRTGLHAMQGRLKELLPLGRAAHRAAKQALMEAAQLLNRFETEVLSLALAGCLTNHAIAQLNDLAYRTITKAGLRNKLEKRIGTNLDLREEVDAAVEEAIRGADVAALPDADPYGTCAISCCNYKEALQAGDCLCLALDVERPEAAIMDPTRLIIKAITPTRITADSFLDALNYALGSAGREAEQVHGGFQRAENDGVVVGEGREPITGVLPLFINPTHWSVARQLAKPVFGWMCTLNPLGYTDDQMRTVPFLVLGRALLDLTDEEAPSEFRTWVAEQVLQTCGAVYRWRRRRVLGDLVGGSEDAGADGQGGGGAPARCDEARPSDAKRTKVEGGHGAPGDSPPPGRGIRFLTGGPAARTVDVVASGEVMLMQLLCALRAGDVEMTADDWEALKLAVLEEEMRRCQALASWNVELGTAGAAARVMNLDPEAAAAAAVARWDDARPQGGDGPTLGSPESLQQLEQGVVAAAAAVDWAAALAGGRAARELAVAQNAYEARVAPLLRLLGVVQAASASGSPVGAAALGAWAPPARVAEWLTPAQLAALLLQNGATDKNSERRAWIAEGWYVDPFVQAEEVLRRLWKREVFSRVQAAAQNARGTSERLAASRRAAHFGAAATLEEAAEAMAGRRLGRAADLRLMVDAVCTEGAAIPAAKMRLLMGWDHAGRRLREDKAREGAEQAPGVSGWAPARRVVHRFLGTHRRTIGVDEAVELFRGVFGRRLSHALTEAYIRQQYAGSFPNWH